MTPPGSEFNPRTLYAIVLGLTGAALLSAAAAPWYRVLTGSNASEASSFVSAIIAALALTIASAIFLPEIRLKSIAEQQEHRLNTRNQSAIAELQKEFAARSAELRQGYEHQVDRLRQDLARLDAHMSRATGIQVIQHDTIWAFGWLLRASRRYLDLTDGERDRYADLLIMISVHVRHCAQALKGDLRSGVGFLDVAKLVNTKILADSPFFVGSDMVAKDQKRRKVVRLIKDFFDLSLFYATMTSKGRKHTDGIRDVLLAATPSAYVLALALMQEGTDADRLAEELKKITYFESSGEDSTAYDGLVKPALLRAKDNLATVIADFLDDRKPSNLGVNYIEFPPV